jgi:hypothetical protein
MKRFRNAVPLAVCLGFALACGPSHAAFHLWTLSEFFSNADGSVQFIEMVSSGPTETVAVNAEIRTTTDGNVFDFPANLTGNTTNRRLLLATANFNSLPGGITPNYTIPANFFDPAGDRIRLFQPQFQEFHSRTFSSVPTDGVLSLNYPPAGGSQAVNSPTNYAGTVGSVDLSPPPPMTTGDYNGNGVVDAADYTVWRDTLGQSVAMAGDGADGSGPGDVPDGVIDQFDYEFWKDRFGDVVDEGAGAVGTSGIAVPEPAGALLLVCVLAAAATRISRRLTPRAGS